MANLSLMIQATAATPARSQAAQDAAAAARDAQNAARDIGNEIRQSVREQVAAARAQGGAPLPPTPPARPEGITIRTADGRTIIGVPPGFAANVIPPQAVDISIAFFLTVAAIIIGLPLARAFARRMDRRGTQQQIPSDVSAQLNQLAQAVDAIALEVERISEGQRFTTRLLSEQRDASARALPTSQGR